MALVRLALKNLGQRMASASSSSSLVSQTFSERGLSTVQEQRWGAQLLRRLSTAAGDHPEKTEGREVVVSDKEDGEKFKLFPRRKRRKGLWKKNTGEFVPSLSEFFHSGVGNALVQATENINKLFEKLAPSGLIGKMKEKDDRYVLKFNVPGLRKEEVKITVVDGIFHIKGEHVEEEEDESDNEHLSVFGIFDTSLVLPEDAKVDEIKAEMKDGVLVVIIPKAETAKKDVKVVEIL